MKRRDFLGSMVVGVLPGTRLAAREEGSKSEQKVTRVVIYKKRRKLYLLKGSKVVAQYRIGLGGNPKGHKQFRGDGKTPEGSYFIDRRNPNSKYHLSLGISYPNARDLAYARTKGRHPGGDIFIHGRAGEHIGQGRDWTAGCIAVSDRNMEKIYKLVSVGTQVDIHP